MTGLPALLPARLTDWLAERPAGAEQDIHFTTALATTVIEALTAPGEAVLDPFVGYGTTAAAALTLGRRAVGVELLPEHLEVARERAPGAVLIEGDARGLHALGLEALGPFALCLTSPPYRTHNDHPADPLSAYERDGVGYDAYLAELAAIAARIRDLLRPGGRLVLNVANIRHRGETTRLAWDVAAAIDPVLPFVAETVLAWDTLPHDFTGDYLLTFAR